MKKIISFFLLMFFILLQINSTYAKDETSITVTARYAIGIERGTGTVVFEKNAYECVPMASTTKIMTAIIVLENCTLNEKVIISKKADAQGGSSMKIRANQEYTVEELLHGLLIVSGNDAAVALAEHVAGTVEEFSKLMNSKAIEIGAYNSSFENPHGLDSQYHYTTAYDLALIASYALEKEVFRKIVSTRSIYIGNRSMNNTNAMLSSYSGAKGIKTGFTNGAGRCLVTYAEKNGKEYISVVLNCNTSELRKKDSTKILNYCFNNFSIYELCKENEIYTTTKIENGIQKYLYNITKIDKSLCLNDELYQNINTRVIITNNTAPIKKYDKTGYIEWYTNDKSICMVPLYADKDIYKINYIYCLLKTTNIWLKSLKILDM